eukprot:g488.t1
MEAYGNYVSGLEVQKHDVTLHANAAIASIKTRSFAQAIEHCDKVLDIAKNLLNKPDHPLCLKALQRRALAYRSLGHYKEALSDLIEVSALVPDAVEVRSFDGEVFKEQILSLFLKLTTENEGKRLFITEGKLLDLLVISVIEMIQKFDQGTSAHEYCWRLCDLLSTLTSSKIVRDKIWKTKGLLNSLIKAAEYLFENRELQGLQSIIALIGNCLVSAEASILANESDLEFLFQSLKASLRLDSAPESLHSITITVLARLAAVKSFKKRILQGSIVDVIIVRCRELPSPEKMLDAAFKLLPRLTINELSEFQPELQSALTNLCKEVILNPSEKLSRANAILTLSNIAKLKRQRQDLVDEDLVQRLIKCVHEEKGTVRRNSAICLACMSQTAPVLELVRAHHGIEVLRRVHNGAMASTEEATNVVTETTELLPLGSRESTSADKKTGCLNWKGEGSLDFRFLKRILKLLCILRAYPALVLPLLSVLNAHVVARVGKITGKFYSVCLDGDRQGFWSLCRHATILFVISACLYAFMQFLAEYFAYLWRERLTRFILELYSQNKHFYWLEKIDNPDQRIAQDLSLLCDTLGKLLKELAAVPYNLIYYTHLVYQQLQSVKIMLMVYAWFIGGTLFFKFLVRPSANLLFAQEAKEGDFRKGMLRFGQYKKEIAVMHGAQNEKQHLLSKLNLVLWHQVRAYELFGTLLNFLCIGKVRTWTVGYGFASQSSGKLAEHISNTSMYLLMLLYSFNRISDSAISISTLLGLTPRVSQLIEGLFQVDEELKKRSNRSFSDSNRCISFLDHDSEVSMRVWHFSCWTLSGRIIVEDLEFILKKGESLLITGASGVGKSTLLLTFNELHDEFKGSIEKLSETNSMMLPQQAIVAPGATLASQLTYPSEAEISPDQVVALLGEVGLGDAWRGWCESNLSKELDWSRVFSTGELQRIAFARVLFHQPQLVFLDEATSALPGNVQKELYDKIKALGITIVSVGQRKSLNKLHDWNLHLMGCHQDGQWVLRSTSQDTGSS